MKISDTLALFEKVEEKVNPFYQSTLQVNFIHPLSIPAVPPDAELGRDFLKGSDQIASNSSFRLTRHEILCSVISLMEKEKISPALVDQLKEFERSYRLSREHGKTVFK